MADRRVRIRAPEPVRLGDLEDLMRSTGALDVALGEGELVARFAADRPRYLEDRIEAWLHLVDRRGISTLETSADGVWMSGCQAVYSGAVAGAVRFTLT